MPTPETVSPPTAAAVLAELQNLLRRICEQDRLDLAPETRLDKNGKSSTMQITWKIAFGGAGGREAVFNYFAGLLNSPVLGTRKTDAGN